MANNNVQNVRFLRNGSLYSTRDAALTRLNGQTLAAEQDGSIILARYGSGDNVKTLVGLVYVSGSNKSLTIFDIEGASGDVDALRTEINNKLGTGITSGNTATAQLTALSGTSADGSGVTSVWGAKAYAKDYTDEQISSLDYTDTAVEGSYVSQVSEADGIISVTRVALPDASSVSGDSKVVIDVTQDKGQITATAANITGVKLDGYAEGTDADIAATDTLGEALGKLQAQINAMDKDADVVDGKVVTTVTEVDGKVTETKANVKDLQLGGYAKTNDTGDIASADTINVALSKLENKAAAITIGNADHSINVTTAASGTDIAVNIKSGEKVVLLGNDGIYTDLDLVKITGDSLPAEIKERYQLLASDDTQIGVNIDIPKDSHIVSINYITTGEHAQNLEYVYIDVSGNTQTTYVDMSELVLEAEFASGVTVTDHIVRGVVDPTSEKDSRTSGAESFLTVDTNGFKVSGIKDEIDRKINALDVDVINPGAGKYIYAIEENDGKIAASGSNVSEAVLNNYSKGSDSGDVASTDTINEAISKLENRLDGKVDALDADVSGNSTHVTVGVAEENGIITAVTVAEDNIANADELAELSAKTVTALTSTNGSITASIDDAVGCKTYDIETDASKIKMSGFTSSDALSGITSSSSITEAFQEVDRVITSNEQVTSSALNDLNTRLSAETEARKAVDGQNGDTYAANANVPYISGATSLNDADIKLANAISELGGDYIKGVQVNGTNLPETNNIVNVQVSGATTALTGTSTEAIVVNTDNNTGAVTLGLNYLDCGTY